MRLGEPEATNDFAAGHPRQPTLTLLGTAIGVDGKHAERRLHRHKTAQRRIAPLEFTANQSVTHGIETRAPVTFERGAEQAKPRHGRNQLTRKTVLGEAAANDRQYLVINGARD